MSDIGKLSIIGMGPGDEAMITEVAKSTLATAHRILHTREMPLSSLVAMLKKTEGGSTAVLVSGDSGFFSVAATIVRDFDGLYEIEIIPGISSIQYFSAKIKIPYEDAALVSLHGRNGNIVAKASYNKKIFALTGGANGIRDICRSLCRCGLGNVSVSVGERLSYPNERIIHGNAENLKDMDFDGLSVMYIENLMAINPHMPLCDSDFIRGDTPMTKEEVRWLSIQKLGVSSSDIVFDIGAGTGSVSVELARKAFDGFVYAIEAKEGACALVQANATKHGAFNIQIVRGEAPWALAGLPIPDKAFIGGSSGNMGSILEKLIVLNPMLKVTATAITLQTLHQITESFKKYGIGGTDIVCVNIAKARKAGGCDIMMAQNPVYIITGVGGGHV